ncbi:hypothetical protein BK136_16645 [Paenibacillus amylolyticus]|nr:hypothetical protein BK136_16645 [Paenibacillus amylolyticus]
MFYITHVFFSTTVNLFIRSLERGTIDCIMRQRLNPYMIHACHERCNKFLYKVLIQQLRELERDGLVTRHVYQQMPPKVEYGLTEYGVTANTIVDVMCAWGRDNIALRQQRGEDIVLLENNDSES